MNKDRKPFKLPKILLFLGTLRRNPLWPKQKWRVRVIKFDNSGVLFDVRQFDDFEHYKGYNAKGTALNLAQAIHLRSFLNRAIPFMAEYEAQMEKENASKSEEVATTPQETTSEDQTD